MNLYTPDQYADLALSEIEAVHHAKTGEFLNLGKYRDVFIKHFRMSIEGALEQASNTVKAALDADVDPVEHIKKHMPK